MTDVLQHHISEQLSLGGVQEGPLFLGEVHSYILEGHRFLKHHIVLDTAISVRGGQLQV